MEKAPKTRPAQVVTSTGPTDKPQDRRLQERELRAREEELRQFMATYELASHKVSETFASFKQAVKLMELLQHKCDHSPVLRSAMVARLLAVKNFGNDIKFIHTKAQRLAKAIHRTGSTHKSFLEQTIKNPELLR